jgi:molecular chaperone DnaK (HSP70)
MRYAVGVDLGTTHTAAAVARSARTEIFELGTDRAVVPSVVALADEAPISGDAAERHALDDPASAAREFKRRLGDPTPFLLSGVPYGAEALMGTLLRDVLAVIATEMSGAPHSVALTHPAAYGAYKLDMVREAARAAGLDGPLLISEPEAAAVEYAATRELADGSVVVVYDLGGGTFDVSLVVRRGVAFEPVGTPGGLERFGGADVDRAVLGHVRGLHPEAFEQLDSTQPEVRRDLARLISECRRAKEALSFDTAATIPVRVAGFAADVRVTRGELEAMVRPRLEDTLAAAERVLRGAALDWDGVAAVLLVGGASRMPLIAEWLAQATGRPVAVDAHPKHAVALGAARMAAAEAPPAGSSPDPAVPGAGSGTVPWSDVQAALEQLRREER